MSDACDERYMTELRLRLQQFFDDQVEGFDVPPARLYGLEGFIDCGLFCGLADAQTVRRVLIELASAALGDAAAELYRRDERLILHCHMAVAPVYPSTSES